MKFNLSVEEAKHLSLCLLVHNEPRAFPAWTEQQVARYLRDNYRRYEMMLSLGAYHHLLPTELRRRTVVEQFNVPRFVEAVERLQVERASDSLSEELLSFLH